MMKKIMTIVLSGIMMLSFMIMPIHASSSYQAQLYASVTDAGEVVDRIVIDFHSLKSLKGITKNSFTINAKSIVDFGVDKGNVYYDTNRTIEKVKKMGKKVILYLNQGEGSSLTWLTEQRNYPAKLIYTITLNHDLYSIKKEDVRFVIKKKIINEETSKFRGVKGHCGLNYQFYNANSRRLIVWFHGNGEGDIKGQTHNNVAQMLANRGTVGWATKEAQRTFKGANVMAFQVPDTWYNADKDFRENCIG
jgi:predicted peptidase